MIDPAVARARLEIAGDLALIKKLISDASEVNLPPGLKSQARIASLKRLIAANKALLVRLEA